MDLELVIKDLGLFAVILIIFILILSIVLKKIRKNFKLDKNKIKIYGILFNLNNKSLVAVSCIIVNYIFLNFLLVTFHDINIFYCIFSCILVLTCDILGNNYKKIPIHILLNLINMIAIKIVYLLYDYISNEYFSTIVLISLILVIIFIFLYFTYNLFKQINNTIIKEKYLNNKNYKI